MLIMSQDKDLVINVDNITVIGISQDNQKEIDSITVDGETQFLAEYETAERAKEILNEITIAYSNIEMVKIPGVKIHEIISAAEIIRNIRYVMPEK